MIRHRPITAFISLTLSLSTMAADYEASLPEFEALVRREMTEWGISGVTVALIDDQETVYNQGFGEAKADSIFRVGSISKLFNAIAVMQLVESGTLDLDAPIDLVYLPVNPFPDKPAVTFRQILSHRSGLQRESTVGGYLDPGEPSLEATVSSLRQGVLVTRPESVTRYSNIAPSLAGYLVERASGQTFADYQNEHIHQPLGMRDAFWHRANLPEGRLVQAYMRVADGKGAWRREKAPLFDLGTIPAGNLFTTSGDLGRFASSILAGGRGLMESATLAAMFKPQFTEQDNGFGLGFVVGKFRQHPALGHSGAVYGYSTSLTLLPEAKVAAVVLANEDIASGRVAAIREGALNLLLEGKHGEQPPAPEPDFEISDLSRFTGEFQSESFWAKLEVRNGQLVGDLSGQPTRFRTVAENRFLTNSRITFDGPVTFETKDGGPITGFRSGNQFYRRVGNETPIPDSWRNHLGSYGHAFIPLIVTERHGHFYVMTENMVDYRLTPVNSHTFALPPGMYVNEHLVFLSAAAGPTPRIDFCSMFFNRRP